MCWCVSAHVHALTAYKQQYRFNYCRPSSCLLQWFRVCRCKLECLLGFFFNFVGLFVCWGKVCWLITSSVFLILQFCTDVVENNTCLAVEHHWKSLFSDILLIGTKKHSYNVKEYIYLSINEIHWVYIFKQHHCKSTTLRGKCRTVFTLVFISYFYCIVLYCTL